MQNDKEQNIESILQVTKDVIKFNNNFHEYYISKNDDFYEKQLDLLLKKSELLKKLNKNKLNKSLPFKNSKSKNLKIDCYSSRQISDIRNLQIRSSKLPPLCPFYDDKGTLMPSVISTSKINVRNLIYKKCYNTSNIFLKNPSQEKIFCNTHYNFGPKSMKINNIKKSIDNSKEKIKMENFVSDIFHNPEFANLKYEESEIFGKKDKYLEIIKNKINDLKLSPNQNFTIKKEKAFEWSKRKKKIYLLLESINIQFYEVKKKTIKQKEKKENFSNSMFNTVSDNLNFFSMQNFDNKTPINNNNYQESEEPFFEFYLPLSLLPLFYCKGDEKFKLILSQIVDWDSEKFSLNKDSNDIISRILLNCEDFDMSIDKKEDFGSNLINRVSTLKKKKRSPPPKVVNSPIISKFVLPSNKTIVNLDYSNIGSSFNSLNNINLNNKTNRNEESIIGSYSNKETESIQNNNILYSFDIYPNKNNTISYFNQNCFEFIWKTNTKVFKVVINMPLISLFIPSNGINIKQYVDWELLFYMYKLNFVSWDFYCINYLNSFKNFRTLIKQLNSVSQNINNYLYLTKPHVKKYSFNDNKVVNIISKPKNINQSHCGTTKLVTMENIKNNFSSKNDDDDDDSLLNSVLIQKSAVGVVNYIDNNKNITNQYIIHLNFEQLQKFEIMEKYINKVSFLIKFLNINYEKDSVSINYSALNSFDEQNWIKDLKKYNLKYLQFLEESRKNKENENNNDIEDVDKNKKIIRFEGIKKGTIITEEIKCPIAVNRTINEEGIVDKEIYEVSKKSERRISKLSGKDNMYGLAKIFYDETDQNKIDVEFGVESKISLRKPKKKGSIRIVPK